MIRNFLLGALFVGIVTSCNNQGSSSASSQESGDSAQVAQTDESTGLGKIEYENASYEFGTVKEGTIVEHVFKFKNTGTSPVILAQVSASCGCTTPDYTKEPILPGKEGEVKVSFDSNGQVGAQQKIVTISSNAENRVSTVQIKGIVEKS